MNQPLYQLVVRVPQALAESISDWLETLALAVTIDLEPKEARISGLFLERFDDVLVRQHLAALSADGAHFDWQLLPPTDWLAATARGGAGAVGSFMLLQNADAKAALITQKALSLKSAYAFGDGFHATSQACLLALEWLQPRLQVSRFADVGCGTGVLALAARKLWPQAHGLLIDVDSVAIKVARQNTANNGGPRQLHYAVGAGLAARAVPQQQPFDLLLANILAGPLCRLAPSAAQTLRTGGCIVLSGLLAQQQRMVLSAYRQQRLRLVKSYLRAGWVTLVLKK